MAETSWPAENWNKIISIESQGNKPHYNNHKIFFNKFAYGVMFKNTLKGFKRHLEK